MSIDLTAIKTFCRAIEDGNLTRAARGLHITKSVASRRIRSLEDQLGVKLLNRSTKGVTATDEGQLYYERCNQILDDLEEAGQLIRQDSQQLTGTIRLTAPFDFANLHLSQPLAAFMKQHPDLHLDMDSTDMRTDIVTGGYDLALRITGGLEDSSLRARKIAPLKVNTVASPGYLAEHGTPRTPQDLKDHNCIFYSNVSSSLQWRFIIDGKHESVRVKGRITNNSGHLQMEMAKAGHGIASLPVFFTHRAVETDALVPILTDFERPTLYLYALYPESHHKQLKVRALIDFLLDWFREGNHSSCL